MTATTIAGVNRVGAEGGDFLPEAVYLGGPVSAPGYAYHSLVSFFGFAEHVELPATPERVWRAIQAARVIR